MYVTRNTRVQDPVANKFGHGVLAFGQRGSAAAGCYW